MNAAKPRSHGQEGNQKRKAVAAFGMAGASGR